MEEKLGDFAVAPGEGAWIEITKNGNAVRLQVVAPGEGAWIEIKQTLKERKRQKRRSR